MIFAFASRFSSITMCIPLRSDSSRRSDIPSILLSFTSSAIFSISLALFTWYGISVTTIRCLFSFTSCISVRARIIIRPRPVAQALLIPLCPMIRPAVGKSGPLIYAIKSNGSKSGSSISAMVPFITSLRLCGGIFVAIPTAIPDEPFTNSCGNRAGNTTGSSIRPS